MTKNAAENVYCSHASPVRLFLTTDSSPEIAAPPTRKAGSGSDDLLRSFVIASTWMRAVASS
jgi:hypothetical protein